MKKKYNFTTTSFITESNKIHGSLYDYSMVKFNGLDNKIIIICKKHGKFEQLPYVHLRGAGCKKCLHDRTIERTKIRHKNNEDAFIKMAIEKHKTLYDYSLVNYRGPTQKVKVICKKHGIFETFPKSVLANGGCRKCALEKVALKNSKLIFKKKFVEMSTKNHVIKYDYSLLLDKDYFKSGELLKIVCPMHGIFEQKAYAHMSGSNCKKCVLLQFNKEKKLNIDDLKKNAIIKFNNFYDYSKVNYINHKNKVKIICPKHGEFEIRFSSHLNKKHDSCKKCYWEKYMQKKIEKAKEIYNNLYDYSKTIIEKSNATFSVICKIHGEFKTTVNKHITHKIGCPKCFEHKMQKEVTNFISSIYKQKLIENDRKILKPFELDIFLETIKIAFEFNGIFWHSMNNKKNKGKRYYHYNKTQKCYDQHITLISVYSDDWIDKQKIVKNYIKNVLNYNLNVVDANQCAIKIIDEKLKQKFLLENSLFKKHPKSNLNLGLYYNNELAFLFSIKIKNNFFEILEMCEKDNLNVKKTINFLTKYLFKNYNCKKITHSLDRIWFFKNDEFIENKFNVKMIKKPITVRRKTKSDKRTYMCYNCGYIKYVLDC